VSFGRLDQLLISYYRDDLEAGRITPQHAVELLGCFLGKAAELVPLFFERATEYFSGLSSASGVTLGGAKADGSDATNELSWLFLEAYDAMRLRQPNLHLRVHPNTDPALLRRACEVLAGGGGMPAFFNDGAIVPALQARGVSPDHAIDYAVVGCAEWGVPYRSFPAAGAVFVSLPWAFDRALRAHLASARGLDDLMDGFRSVLGQQVARAVAGNNAIERVHADCRPTPLLSLLVRGCAEQGTDVTGGGGLDRPSGLQAVGLADVVDSLAAVAVAVFEQRWCSPQELLTALDEDFVGHEALHARLCHRTPRYGSGDEPADLLAARVSQLVVEVVGSHRNGRGGAYRAGLWSMTTHQGFGSRLGALPSGRRAGEPLANGMGPCRGSERAGPTATLCSAARVADVGNGAVLNLRLTPQLAQGAAGSERMSALVRGYFAQGGTQLQVDVVDRAVLQAAKDNPAAHRDLVVRISGYSAYFTDLTEAMQDELIGRVAHGVDA
jgi:formate C-acetyltransferase